MATSKRIERPKNDDEQMKAPTKRAAKVCFYCESKTAPSYTDSTTLKKFMSDRSRIVSAQRTGLCSKHQRSVTKEIKHARHLALLPFTARI